MLEDAREEFAHAFVDGLVGWYGADCYARKLCRALSLVDGGGILEIVFLGETFNQGFDLRPGAPEHIDGRILHRVQRVYRRSGGTAAADDEPALSVARLGSCVFEHFGHAEPVGVQTCEVGAWVLGGGAGGVGNDGVDGADGEGVGGGGVEVGHYV